MLAHRMLPGEPRLGTGVFGLDHRADEALVHLVPVPFDATVSYGEGAARGPAAILAASAQVDLLDADFGRTHRAGIFMHPVPRKIAAWNRTARRDALPIIERLGKIGKSKALRQRLERVNAAGAAVNAWTEREVGRLLDASRVAGAIGGDHSAPFGAIRAHALRRPGLGILHFDAHADLRDAYEGFTWSHASIMHNVAARIPEVGRIVQVGIRDFSDEEAALIRASGGRIVAFFDRELRDRRHAGEPFRRVAEEIVATLPRDVHVSFDIDGLDPALCPGTGTPVPGGLAFDEACAILVEVVRSGRRIAAFDLNEVAPEEGDREWNANVGARVLYKLVGAAVASRAVAWSAPS